MLARDGRVWSGALDRSVYGRDLASGKTLCAVALDGAPRCLALDVLDSYLLVGCDSGVLLRVDLDAWALAHLRYDPLVLDGTPRKPPSALAYEGHAARARGGVAVVLFSSAGVERGYASTGRRERSRDARARELLDGRRETNTGHGRRAAPLGPLADHLRLGRRHGGDLGRAVPALPAQDYAR